MYVKVTIPLMQAVVNFMEIEKKVKKELSEETFSKLHHISPWLCQSIRIQNALFIETEEKEACVLNSGKKFPLLLQLPVNRRSSF